MATETRYRNTLGMNRLDRNQAHVEAITAVQMAWERAAAANECNDRKASERLKKTRKREEKKQEGFVFSKSRALPNGITDYKSFVPVESLRQYGSYAVLGSGGSMTDNGTLLEWIGGSGSSATLTGLLGGTLAALMPKGVAITLAALIPDTTSLDSAFYSSAQYADMTKGNTRARVTLKHLPDGSVDLYGFYTGNKPDWQNVPVIKAEFRVDHYVANMGGGIKIIWTPTIDSTVAQAIPALEGATLKPAVWIYPPGPKTAQILVDPILPPDYQDAIIWFPNHPKIVSIYLSLSVRRG